MTLQFLLISFVLLQLLQLLQLCQNTFLNNCNKIKFINRNGVKMQNVIVNLDDIIREYKSPNLIEIITHVMPQLAHYNNIEFSISETKLNEIFTNKNQLKIYANANVNTIDIYHECAIRDLQILGKKINVNFSIIYVNLFENSLTFENLLTFENKCKNYIGLDYYISKKSSYINDNNKEQITHVVKNIDIASLNPYWYLSLPIRVIELKKLSLKKISNLQFDINLPYIFNASTLLIC
jgi:hypothetical protein